METMRKKIIAVVTTVSLVLGIGTVTLANSENDVFEKFNFQEMLPFMQKMHPEMNEEQLEAMYNRCHGEGGMMNGRMGNGMNEGMKQQMRQMMKTQGGTGL